MNVDAREEIDVDNEPLGENAAVQSADARSEPARSSDELSMVINRLRCVLMPMPGLKVLAFT